MGIDFILGFMDNKIFGFVNNIELFVMIILNNFVNVIVIMFFFNFSFFSKIMVSWGNIEKIEIIYNIWGFGMVVQDWGVQIVFIEEIIVYGVNKEMYFIDGFVVFLVDVIGKEYVFVMWMFEVVFMIVGIEDVIMVQIILFVFNFIVIFVMYNGGIFINGQFFIVNLNKYQMFYVYDVIGDFMGIKIVVDKVVIVMIGNKKVVVKDMMMCISLDYLVE